MKAESVNLKTKESPCRRKTVKNKTKRYKEK